VPSAFFRDVLVNVADQVPDGFAEFARLIEIVGCDDADRATARQRWKHYTQLGYTIARHDLALRA
jgi:DNA polymerase-3 subunit chi